MLHLSVSIIVILMLLIVLHSIISWMLYTNLRNEALVQMYRTITTLLEPLYSPLRRIVPRAGMIDITPLAAILMLLIILELIVFLS